jgi:hypothetical protein
MILCLCLRPMSELLDHPLLQPMLSPIHHHTDQALQHVSPCLARSRCSEHYGCISHQGFSHCACLFVHAATASYIHKVTNSATHPILPPLLTGHSLTTLPGAGVAAAGICWPPNSCTSSAGAAPGQPGGLLAPHSASHPGCFLCSSSPDCFS